MNFIQEALKLPLFAIDALIFLVQQGYFELRLDRPLPPGQQAFTARALQTQREFTNEAADAATTLLSQVTSTCPAAVNDNVFYIIILTPTGQAERARQCSRLA